MSQIKTENKAQRSNKDLSPGVVLLILFVLLGVHFFLTAEWHQRFFVYFVNLSGVFVDDLSRDYQRVMFFDREFNAIFEFKRFLTGFYWPPLVLVLGLWSSVVFGASFFFLPNYFYLLMAMAGIYLSTYFLIGNRAHSLLAAAIFSCYWAVMTHLVAFELQLAVAACTIWSFYAYLRSDFFTRFWPSLLTGFFMIVGLYCDRLSPLMFTAALFFVPQNFRNKKALFLMLFVLSLVVIGAWPFYHAWSKNLLNPNNRLILFSSYGDCSPSLETLKVILGAHKYLAAHLSYYFVSLTERLLGYGFTGLLGIACFSLQRLKKPFGQVVWLAFGVPLFFFILIPKKDYIYIVPLCVYFAMISGIGIHYLRLAWARFLILMLIIGASTFQYLLLFKKIPYRQTHYFSRAFSQRPSWVAAPKLFLSDYPFPMKENFARARSIVETVGALTREKELSGERGQTVIVDLQCFQSSNIVAFMLRTARQPAKVIHAFFAAPLGTDPNCKEAFLYLLSDKKKYEALDLTKNEGVCSWEGLEPLMKVHDSEIILYKVRR